MSEPRTEPRLCPTCSSPVELQQEYCLECGARLPAPVSPRPGPAGSVRAGWVAPAFALLVLAAVGAGAGIAVSGNRQQEAAPETLTGGVLTLTETQETLTAPEPPATPRPARPSVGAPARRARPVAPRTISWPRGRRGWTIVLLSVPQSDGRAAATRRAEEAREGGLRRVGVLDSSRFANLHPGYYVVFHGVYDAEAEATSVLPRTRRVVRLAYVREIVP